MSSSKKTTTQSKSTRKVQVTRTVTKTGPDVSIDSLLCKLKRYNFKGLLVKTFELKSG